MNDKKINDLSRQYWNALDAMDYEWAEFIDSALEREGFKPLPREECALEIIDL